MEDSLAFSISVRLGAMFEKGGVGKRREIAVWFFGPVVFEILGWKRRRVKARLVSKIEALTDTKFQNQLGFERISEGRL